MSDYKELEELIKNVVPPQKLQLQLELANKKRTTDSQFSYDLVVSVYDEAKKLQLPDIELKALNAICSVSSSLKIDNNFDNWIKLLSKRGTELNDNLSIAKSYIHQYRKVRREGKFTEAAQFLYKALEFLDPAIHAKDISFCYTGLGNIYFHCEDYERCYEYYQKSLAQLKDQPAEQSFVLRQNIAGLHIIKKEYAQAWQIYQDLLPQLDHSQVYTRILVLQNLGHICHSTDQLLEAVVYFEEAIELKIKHNSTTWMVRTYCNLIYVLIDLKDFPKALEVLHTAEKFNPEITLIEQDEICQAYIKYYKMKDDLPGQIEQYEKLLAVRMKLAKEEDLNKINKLEAQQQINLYKEKSIILDEKNKLIAEQNKNLQDAMQKLLNQKNNLENQLKNAFSKINDKDEELYAHQKKTFITEMTGIISQQSKQLIDITQSIVKSIKDEFLSNELSEEIITSKTKIIEELLQYLSQTLNEFSSHITEKSMTDFRAAKVINDTLSLMSFALENENISVNNDLKHDFSIQGSRNELTQVFLNLITYARFSFKKDNTPDPLIEISLENNSDYNLIIFHYNAAPIPEVINDNEYNDNALSLNFCQQIINNRFNAKIYSQNTPEGTFFFIELP